MTALIKFEDLDIAALTVIAAEQYEECLWAIEKALDKQLAFGRLLRIVKEKLPHGEWGTWVRETFTDHKSLRTIQRYMRGADSIATDPSLLECADSLDGILKIVEDRKPVVEVVESAATVPPQQSSPRATTEPEVECTTATDDVPDESEKPQASIVLDCIGKPVPEHLRAAHQLRITLMSIGRELDKYRQRAKELSEKPGGECLHMQNIDDGVRSLKAQFQDAGYYTVCPRCDGTGTGCKKCDAYGWIPEWRKNQIHEIRKPITNGNE